MSQLSPNLSSPPPPENSALTHSLPCVHCGYDLLSQSLQGKCPECGHPVQGSLRGDWLQFCHPAWVRSLAYGITLVYLAATANVLFYLGLQVYFFNHRYQLSYHVWETGAIYAGINFVQLAGLWLLTVQEPRLALREKEFTLRRILRALLILDFLTQPLALALAPGEYAWQSSLYFGVAPLVLLFLCLVFYHLSRLARRVPAAVLENQSLMFLWALPGILVITALARSLQRVIRDSSFNLYRFFPLLAAAWLTIWGYLILTKFVIVLNTAARAARRNAPQTN